MKYFISVIVKAVEFRARGFVVGTLYQFRCRHPVPISL